MKTGRSSI